MPVNHCGERARPTLLAGVMCCGVLRSARFASLRSGFTQGRLAEARLTLGSTPQPLWGRGGAEWSGERSRQSGKKTQGVVNDAPRSQSERKKVSTNAIEGYLFEVRSILPRITNFQKKPASNFVGAVLPSNSHDKDGEPFPAPASSQTRNHGPAQRFPTSPEVAHHAGRVGMRCARPWNPSSQHALLTNPFRTFPAAPHQQSCGRSVIAHLQSSPVQNES